MRLISLKLLVAVTGCLNGDRYVAQKADLEQEESCSQGDHCGDGSRWVPGVSPIGGSLKPPMGHLKQTVLMS